MSSERIRIVLPDTSLLSSFVEAGHLDVLLAFCQQWPGASPQWAKAVELECADGDLPMTALREVFGTSVAATSEQETSAKNLRALHFDTRVSDPLRRNRDMGECVTLVIWSERAALGELVFLLTEDRAAVLFCQQTLAENTIEGRAVMGRRFVPLTCADVLNQLVHHQVITAHQRLEIERDIKACDRGWLGPGLQVQPRPARP